MSIAPSSMRGAGSRGVVLAGRRFLSTLGLARFGVRQGARFRAELDAATNQLIRALPRGAQHWGLARKGLNIFLRECLYTVYLRDEYSLGEAEGYYEVPLDSLTGHALYRASHGSLPRWKTVRGLQPSVSDQFQQLASELATQRGFARIHLDAVWWGERLRVAET